MLAAGAGVAGVNERDDLIERQAVAVAGAQQLDDRAAAGHHLQAAAVAAAADRAGLVDEDVAELACRPARAAVELAAEDQPGADAGRILGRSVAAIVNAFNPELIIVGGALSAAGDVLLDPLREAVHRYAIPSAAEDVRITCGVLGDRAEVLGALELAARQSDVAAPAATTPVTGPRRGKAHT